MDGRPENIGKRPYSSLEKIAGNESNQLIKSNDIPKRDYPISGLIKSAQPRITGELMKKVLRSLGQVSLQHMLKEARQSAGLTQEAVAAGVGKPQSFVAKYESGERLLNVIELIRLLRVLEQDPGMFVSRLAQSVPKDD